MFVDIHAHAYRKPVPFVVQFPSVEELLKRYDECGIEMGCVLPVVNSEIYLPQANEDILEMAEQHPDRIIPFCNVDPIRRMRLWTVCSLITRTKDVAESERSCRIWRRWMNVCRIFSGARRRSGFQ